MKKEMKVVVKEPGKAPEVKMVTDDLYEMQRLVGGWIEIVRPFEDMHTLLVCNEEGVYRDGRPNVQIGNTVIFGPFFVCSEEYGDDGPECAGLADEQADYFMNILG